MSFLPKSVALPRSGYSRCRRRCTLLALSSLTSIGALAVPITELYAYRIDPELGRSWVNGIANNDLMTGEDRSNVGYVMRLHQPALLIPLPPEFFNVLGYSINDAGQVTGVGELLVNGKLQIAAPLPLVADWGRANALGLLARDARPPPAGHF